jgi:hypothetical protein
LRFETKIVMIEPTIVFTRVGNMADNNTVTINGVTYDARTGMRLSEQEPIKKATPKQTVASQSIHQKAQRTKTLAKRHSKAGKRTSLLSTPPKQTTRSPRISRFAATPVPKKTVISDVGPQTHSAQGKHRASVTQQRKTVTTPPAKVIKAKAITDAVAKSSKKKPVKKSYIKKHSRALTVSITLVFLLIIGAYVTYINLPSLSVRLASAQAGIHADYPSYRPSGYTLDGSVTYATGEVTLNFKATGGPQRFTLKQTKSTWDSSALLENYILLQGDKKYETYIDSGLTIYIHGTNAAWVNGGILHTITGNAPLTNDQLRKIALSM